MREMELDAGWDAKERPKEYDIGPWNEYTDRIFKGINRQVLCSTCLRQTSSGDQQYENPSTLKGKNFSQGIYCNQTYLTFLCYFFVIMMTAIKHYAAMNRNSKLNTRSAYHVFNY